MKKASLCIAALLLVYSCAFAADSEGWATFGIGYEATMQMTKNAGAVMHSVGLPIGSYSFGKGKDVGFMVQGNVQFPLSMKAGGVEITASDWKFAMKVDLLMGVGFKTRFSNDLLCYGGIGVALSDYVITQNYMATLGIDLGLGLDVGLKYDFSETFGISIGCTEAVNFLEFGFVKTSGGESSGIVKGYWGIDIRPYICCSINYYKTAGGIKFGKSNQ